MNDLLIGLLSAALATNAPVALSNLVKQKTGVSVAAAASDDPVEQAYQKLMADDDVAQAEVDDWIKERHRAGREETDVEQAAFRARIKRRFEPVIQGYERFIEAHPQHAKVRLAFGSFLNDIGDEEGGSAQWEKARELEPGNPAAWNNLANFNGHRGDVKKAFGYYEKAVELDPNEPVYYQNFATTVFLFRKDAREHYGITEEEVFAKAMGLYRKACALDPENFSMAAELAQTYYGITTPKLVAPAARPKAELKLADEAIAAWRVAARLARNEAEREGINLHFARWQINSDRLVEARKSLDAVTNAMWLPSKQTLLKKLANREAAARETNSPPSESTSPKP